MAIDTSKSQTEPEASGQPTPGGDSSSDALREIGRNLLDTPRSFRDSLIRHGRPTSDRAASQAIFTNVFLHILPTRIHPYSLRIRATLGLGVVSLVLFVLLVGTGIALMVYYKPSTDQAYDSMKEIHYIVPTGRFMRNIHRWAAHGMVLCVLLHMARAFYTGAYKFPRQFNWVVGMILFVLTLMLSFTGYLLPWDQLAYWAVTIGSEIAQSPREVTDALGITSWFDPGGMQKRLILGSNYVGQEALIRFYLLHVMVLPLVMTMFLMIHFWRIRKDGGLTRPAAEDAPPPALINKVGIGRTPEMAPSRTYGLMSNTPSRPTNGRRVATCCGASSLTEVPMRKQPCISTTANSRWVSSAGSSLPMRAGECGSRSFQKRI